jgi:hypothetical protein
MYGEPSSYYDFFTPTFSELIHDYARGVGDQHPDRCWLTTPYDTFVRNPFYAGPEQPCPEL